jgi:hypothetical protein
MVTSVYRPPKPRTGFQPPVLEQWETLRNRLSRAAPPGHPVLEVLNGPADWHTIDRLEAAIAQVIAEKQQPLTQDAATSRKQDEWRALLERYHVAWVALGQARKDVRPIASKRAVRLMAVLPDDWDTRQFPQVSLSVSDIRIFNSLEEGKAAIDEFTPQVLYLEDYVRRIDEVLAFWNDPDRTYFMVLKALERIESLESELRELKSKQSRSTNRKAV